MNKHNNEIWRWSAIQIASAIRLKEVTAVEVMQAHLDRIALINDRLNAMTVIFSETSLEAARKADTAVAEGKPLGPLHGVPVTYKENIDLRNSATCSGVVGLAQAFPDLDAPFVSHLHNAGAIPIGRTNMSDFGLRWHTDNALRGPTRNPWNAVRTPGGSSGGDAVAVATGMTPLGIGNDLGGSLRWPAQCTGVSSLKTSYGRIPRASALQQGEPSLTIQQFAVHGPLARSVADLRLALQVMSQPDARDPIYIPTPLEGPPPISPIRVAVTIDPDNGGVHPDIAAGVRKAAAVLEGAGYFVEEIDPPQVNNCLELWGKLLLTDIRVQIMPSIQSLICSDSLKFLNLAFSLYPELSVSEYQSGFAERHQMAREWSLFQEKYPLILGPVSTQLPFEIGKDIASEDDLYEIITGLRLIVAANLLGLPVSVVPVGIESGLPQAVQLFAPRFREDLCLDAAEAIERELGTITPVDLYHEPNLF